jgi:small subunit ribosomal protein S6
VPVPTYETLFITPPDMAEDDERAAVETLAKIVTDGGGSLVANERMGRRRLAYPIRKFEDGVYVRFLYDSESGVPKELERRIRLSDVVLRSLTVRLEEDWAAAAKKQAKRDAQRRIEAAEEAARQAAAAAAAAAEAESAAEGSTPTETAAEPSEAEAAAPGDQTPKPAPSESEG